MNEIVYGISLRHTVDYGVALSVSEEKLDVNASVGAALHLIWCCVLCFLLQQHMKSKNPKKSGITTILS